MREKRRERGQGEREREKWYSSMYTQSRHSLSDTEGAERRSDVVVVWMRGMFNFRRRRCFTVCMCQ